MYFNKYFIDLSGNNNGIKQDVVTYNIQNDIYCGAMVRSSWSTNWLDKDYVDYKNFFRKIGAKLGFFHTIYPHINAAKDEAEQFFRSVADLRQGEMLAVDLEGYSPNSAINIPVKDYQDWLIEFVNQLRTHWDGICLLIYSNGDQLKANDGFKRLLDMGCKLWFADGNGKPDGASEGCDMHQYRMDTAAAETGSGFIDLDYWYGTEQDWNNLAYHLPDIIRYITVKNKVLDPNVVYTGSITEDAEILNFNSLKSGLSPGESLYLLEYNATKRTVLNVMIAYTEPIPTPVPDIIKYLVIWKGQDGNTKLINTSNTFDTYEDADIKYTNLMSSMIPGDTISLVKSNLTQTSVIVIKSYYYPIPQPTTNTTSKPDFNLITFLINLLKKLLGFK